MTRDVRRAAVIGIALGLDWWLGDPPTALHPVGLVGRAASLLRGRAPAAPSARLRFGLTAPGAVLALAGVAGFALERRARRLPAPLAIALEAGALSTTVALRTLLDRARDVEVALAADDLAAARALVGRHLVSRDTRSLDGSEVAGATVESVAENLCDGVVAPLLAYAVAGLPGALVYRAANTFDSLWGYRTPEFLELGRHVARLDDALNLLPSRLSAATIVVAAALRGTADDARHALAVWIDEGDFTPSPNAGQSMGAMAGALGVELAKAGEYRLGDGLPRPAAADIERARRLAMTAAALATGALVLGLLVRGAAEARR